MQQVFRREGINLYYYSNKTKKFSLDSWYLPQLHLLESKRNKKSKAATDLHTSFPDETRKGSYRQEAPPGTATTTTTGNSLEKKKSQLDQDLRRLRAHIFPITAHTKKYFIVMTEQLADQSCPPSVDATRNTAGNSFSTACLLRKSSYANNLANQPT